MTQEPQLRLERARRCSAAQGWLAGLRARFVDRIRLGRSVLRFRPFETDTPAGRSLERYRRIALTSVTALAVRLVGTTTGLVTVPLVFGYLGKERYGLWTALTTIVAWISLFDFGVSNGLVNAVARANGRDDRREADEYVATAFWSLTGISVLLLVALAVMGPLVKWDAVFAAEGVYEPNSLMWCAIAAIASFVIAMPLSVVPQIYAGYQRTYVANAFTLIGVCGGFAALVLAVRGRVSMPALILVFGVGTLVASTSGLLYARFGAMPWLRLRPSSVTRAALRGLVTRSVPIFLFQVGALAVNQTQSILLAHRCDLRAVADYGVVMRVYLLVMSLIQLTTGSFVPTFREARERGDHEWLRRGFRRFVRVRVAFATAGGLGLIVGGDAFLHTWLRTDEVHVGWAAWAGLAVLMVSATWVTAHSEVLAIMDRLWIQVALVLVNGAVSVALTYWWAPQLRVLGVVLGTGAVTVLVYVWLVPLMTRRVFDETPVYAVGDADRAGSKSK